jgi:ribosome-associated protein YbcJ (S4-like RNA binding protein)
MSIEKIEIITELYKIGAMIKLSGFCVTGGEAKNLILQTGLCK